MAKLYRQFDKDGRLLYVGVTSSVERRHIEHKCYSPWFDKIASVTYEDYAIREEALEAEREAIITERPLANKQGLTSPLIERLKETRMELGEGGSSCCHKTEDEIRILIAREAEKLGSVAAWCELTGMSPSYVYEALKGSRSLSSKMMNAAGYRRVILGESIKKPRE